MKPRRHASAAGPITKIVAIRVAAPNVHAHARLRRAAVPGTARSRLISYPTSGVQSPSLCVCTHPRFPVIGSVRRPAMPLRWLPQLTPHLVWQAGPWSLLAAAALVVFGCGGRDLVEQRDLVELFPFATVGAGPGLPGPHADGVRNELFIPTGSRLSYHVRVPPDTAL